MPSKGNIKGETNRAKQPNYTVILAVYLLGLLVGGLYVGMVSPARTVIQESFGIGDGAGIWVITIYTLFYAALIPVIGKLGDRSGRKRVFVACNVLFAAGSLACGLSGFLAWGYPLLLVGRVIQAVGACGMIPVANAEIGASFPAERRGVALGLAAAVAGLANVLGAGVGSAVLGLVGSANWGFMFLAAVPLCLCLVVVGLAVLPQGATKPAGKLDVTGAVFFVLFVLCLLLALNDFDCFDVRASIMRPKFGLCLVLALVFALIFLRTERKAEDPVFYLKYFHSCPILITMVLSFFIGCTIITMTLIPEFAEHILHMPAGSGGYYVVPIGVFAMAGPILAGKLIDKHGVKPVLLFGLVVSALGFLFLATAVVAWPNPATMIIGMGIMGLGMGFTMGTPTNYMVLQSTPAEESGAAIGSITLVRQIGTTVAPALLVGFIASGATSGYQAMLLCVLVFNAIGAVLTLAYREPSKSA